MFRHRVSRLYGYNRYMNTDTTNLVIQCISGYKIFSVETSSYIDVCCTVIKDDGAISIIDHINQYTLPRINACLRVIRWRLPVRGPDSWRCESLTWYSLPFIKISDRNPLFCPNFDQLCFNSQLTWKLCFTFLSRIWRNIQLIGKHWPRSVFPSYFFLTIAGNFHDWFQY
jgi:hypothetical protein